MPEPQNNLGQGTAGEDGSPAAQQLTLAERALLQPNPESTDDSPTIISKPLKSVLRTEGALGQDFRGRRLAHFELIEPIGVGGMAAVIRARDIQLDRQVALKILPPEMAAETDNVQRFHQEARAAARLDHEHIARVFYCGEDQGLHFIAFEFVEGDNLRALLERDGPLPIPEAVRHLLQIALGLVHAAERGVVHRDIKPSNIIISSGGKAKLVDMGLARSLRPLGGGDLTHSGVTLGTFDYISPEQALEPREADVRSDIYSLGCTFYQLLTGQAPVPEGTAAKKLHYHQHVPPVDPRQLNPAIPDELARILSRMMAKNAEDRYQDPLHLAKHLHELAERLGMPTEAPSNLHTVVVPPPRWTPRHHPALVTAASVLLLVVLVAVQGAVSTPSNFDRDAFANWTKEGGDRNDVERTAHGSPENQSAPQPQEAPAAAPDETNTPTPYKVAVATLSELEQAILESRNHAEAIIEVMGEMDLALPAGGESGGRGNGLVYDGPGQLTIQPGEQPSAVGMPAVPIFHVHCRDPRERGADSGAQRSALTVKAGKVTVRGLRFELDVPEAEISLAALRVREGGQLITKECEFVQRGSSSDSPKGRLSAVIVDGSALNIADNDDRTQFEAVNCIFRRRNVGRLGMHEAVTLAGPARVRVSSCAFGPHHAVFHLLERSMADVRMQQCSAFLLDGVCFWIEERAGFGNLRVENSIFSRPVDEPPPAATPTALFRCFSDVTPDLHFTGHGNAYHNLGAFLVKGDERLSWAQFVQRIQDVRDEQSRVVGKWPWSKSKPLDDLDDNQPQIAFALDVDHPDLRHGADIIGIQAFAGQLYRRPLPRVEETSSNVRIVDPAQEAEGNRYKSLADAVVAARAGDTVLIQHDGLLAIEPVAEKGRFDLTLKSADGFHPVLTLKGAREAEAVLFRIYDGELRFEKLEFLLRPRQRGFRESQAVVGIFGAGRCNFADCVITLDGGDGDAALSVVALADPSKVMSSDGDRALARSYPDVAFANCFVRGRGECLRIPASRAFDLKISNTVLALDGSVVGIGGNPTDPPPDAQARVTLEHITTFCTGNLLQMRTNKNKNDLVPVRVTSAAHCLFAAANPQQPLIQFAGDITDDQLRNRLSWQGEHNAYSHFVNLLEQQVKNDEMMMGMPEPYKRARWESFTQETNSRFEPVRFSATTPGEGALAKAAPGAFRIVPEPGTDVDFGADIAKLPAPWIDKGVGAATRGVD